MKRILFLFLLIYITGAAQTIPTTPLKKDPYFNQSSAPKTKPGTTPEKIKLIHADSTNVRPELYEGNPFLRGNVEVHHQGSIFKGDEVVLYQKENFIKAKGNIDITNPDGTHLTSDEAEYDGNTRKAIAKGNVVLTDPKQTIKTETLYYDRNANTAYFNDGGVINVHQDNSVITTKIGTYYVNEQRIVFDSNYRIVNDEYITDGKNVNYLRGEGIAVFNGPTTVTNKKNPSNYVYTEQGRYLMNSKEVYLKKNSRIHYNGKILTGDDMYFNQITGFGKAIGNVKLDDPAENRYILGGYGEIYEKTDSAVITEKPYAIKVLKTDSVYIAAKKILAYQKLDSKTGQKKSYMRAFKQARMFKTNAQGRSDSLAYNETDGVMHFVGKPVFWAGERQVTGDTIRAYSTPDMQRIDSVRVVGDAFAISKVDSLNLKDEFNQVKGKIMTIYFQEGQLKEARVKGNAQAITYADNQDEKTKKVDRIGIAYSTCGEIITEFEEKKVQTITCNIGALTDLYPMSKVAKAKRFFPDFNWNTKDRLQRWRDIFLDTPNYPEKQYTSDNTLYDAAQGIIKGKEDAQKAKEPKRVKKE
ncbi:OstA-like protein [Elizabethkingia ursingii]|jgi:lipopolysaccharide export system protein LptA|uniref:Organic solvent tolerance protein OstA n=1 Tax=Elizabethkingia ursingii TaxID=1756150 RepID=A0AAJ3TND8_9FLAO|nr:OstA-like protein [Elizabethkingia ursingii]AQX09253.1 organic solvent tolerance protein OstA [Elizabethkingia ursingii]MCL1662841.1 organic solvent tolerance protein OstA [Elizabethkingia ursingii]MCL1670297.1 organic solvent tolerance protein OstA [Elizabethkingia ursingii]OPB74378.1 organic solvent tolerance protein OstA [Elizabethkingia ursingii]OPB93327.1 organic solvent tolerance protein OstA [Elizabethkingia ursingii]